VCSCGHHHHHHDGHDADEVFTSWGVETAKKFSEADIRAALSALDGGKYGAILRAKGIVDGPDGWLEFDFVPGESEVRPENLTAWLKENRSTRVVVEYNGMWMLDTLYSAMPESWAVYQEFMFADAGTFLTYNANMRQLTYDKLKSCELVVFNRFKKDMDKMPYHKIVRGASRRTDIAYEYASNKVEYDDIEDPLPYDLNAPVTEIKDEDYAIWYRDMSETPKNYEGKTVSVKVRALTRKKLPAGTFIVGRHIMTCCVQDTQFAALVCQWDKADTVTNDSWMVLTAKINFKFNRAYGKKGPVLTYVSAVPCQAPENPVATFY
jgi:hypothetical protein